MTYPYSDDYMTFNDDLQQYVLTSKDLLDNYGIDLDRRLGKPGAANVTQMVNATLKQISTMVYDYIYDCTIHNAFQTIRINTYPSARSLIKRAMEEQTLYYLQNGNLGRSTDKNKKAMKIDEECISILNRPLTEDGISLTYRGV